jgi:hypothetical protein
VRHCSEGQEHQRSATHRSLCRDCGFPRICRSPAERSRKMSLYVTTGGDAYAGAVALPQA